LSNAANTLNILLFLGSLKKKGYLCR